MTLTSYGAAGEVTGSKHLLEVSGKRLLFDCGMFQGSHHDDAERNRTFPFEARTIDAVVLSHGHLDHCGNLPTLVHQGFGGLIYATSATRDVAELIMRDAAKIQQQDTDYHNRHRERGQTPAQPLYTDRDVDATVERFAALADGECRAVLPGVELCFFNAGHILGSSLSHLTITEGEQTLHLAYSGDLGQQDMPLLRPPDRLPPTDVLILESTYGYRARRDPEESERKLEEVIGWAVERRGKVFVPAFALGRMQTLIYRLHRLIDRGRLPNIPIYVDSPLASKLTTVFVRHHDEFDQEAMAEFNRCGHYPFGFLNLHYVESVEESKHLDTLPGPMLILSTSGMMDAGRILHHLRQGISDPNNVVLIVGYMARGTIGRAMLDGAKTIRIHRSHLPVRARIEKINTYSAHAGKAELVDFVRQTPSLQTVYLVHGEEASRQALAATLTEQLPQLKVVLPTVGTTYQLS